MAEPIQSFTFSVDPRFDASQRSQIGEAVIERIIDRTKGGVGTNGPFGTYSESYRTSAEFEAAGKGRQVNLTLTGDMLDSIQVLDVSVAGLVTIGFFEGEENDRAAWMVDKGYPFLGLDDSEIDNIVAGFTPESFLVGEASGIASGFAQQLLRGLFGNET